MYIKLKEMKVLCMTYWSSSLPSEQNIAGSTPRHWCKDVLKNIFRFSATKRTE
jgi:hypothetical protein